MSDNVIDPVAWLLVQAERLAKDSSDEAIPYLERLLTASSKREHRVYALKSLGILHLNAGDLAEARKFLGAAAKLEPRDPETLHAVGRIAAAERNWWLALVYFLEAVHEGRDRDDVVHFMQSVAAAMRRLQFGETAVAVLIGALERAPEDPFVLDSLARFYETEERWLEAIQTREALSSVLTKMDAEAPFDTTQVRAQIEGVAEKMRGDLKLVGPELERDDGALARLNLPSGLHTVVRTLGLRPHNRPLLETAQALWAKALHEGFDVHLQTATLAAGIHWIVERLYFRIPTELPHLAELYGADLDRLPAVVRLLVACLDVEYIPTAQARQALGPQDVQRFERVQRALLFDDDLLAEGPRAMLADETADG